jgi:hypothetical protein
MYYLKLFSTQDNGDGAPEVVPGSQHEGSVLWVRGYNCIRNVGGGVGWYKSYVVADDFMELKSAQDAHGIIISGGTNEVTFTFNGHNKSKYPINPGGSASGGAIYMGSTGGTTTSTLVDSDKAQFRGVGRYNYVIKSGTSGAITSPQLQCQIDGRDVMLKGNGVDQAVAWNTCDGSPCVELHFIDGLLKKVVKSSSTVAGSDYYSDSTVGSYEPNMTSCVLGSCDTATT